MKFYTKLKNKIELVKLKQHLPKNPQHNDIYLVEFPKSGVTWLSFLLSNCLLENNLEYLTYYNHHKYVIDIHQLRGAKISKSYPFRSNRLIKSHSMYNPYYYFVIYLLRNPFDVMLSYYYFMRSSSYPDNFENFVKSPKFGIKPWADHVRSWIIDNKDLPQRIHLIKYEDLIDNSKYQLELIFKNIGLKINDEKIYKAIKYSSQIKMKDSEIFYSKNNPVYKKSNMEFVRKCIKGQKDEIMNNKTKDFIHKESEDITKLFYPNEIV